MRITDLIEELKRIEAAKGNLYVFPGDRAGRVQIWPALQVKAARGDTEIVVFE